MSGELQFCYGCNERFSARLGLSLDEIERLIQASKESLAPMADGLQLLEDASVTVE